MTQLTPLLEKNRAFAEGFLHGGMAPMPRRPIVVVGCIDPRADPTRIFDLGLGEAIVVRNAGGRVTEELEQELAFLAFLARRMGGDALPPVEIALVQHTDCGLERLAAPDLRAALEAQAGLSRDRVEDLAIHDHEARLGADLERLARSPLVPGAFFGSGHLYDVASGLVRTVCPAVPLG